MLPMPYLPMVKAIAPKAPIGADFHDEADDAEEHMGDLLDEVEDQRASAAERVQGEAEHEREQQNLKYLALGERIDHVEGMMCIRNSVVLSIFARW